jgi:hypothetical protein
MTPAVFRPRKRYLWLGLASLGFFWGMAILSCVLYLVGEVPLLMLILGIVVWGVMGFLALWLVLAYLRESLTIDGQMVSQRGVLFSTALWLPDVSLARWIVSPEGAVVLESPLGRVKIYLGNFELPERLLLIRLLRALLPEDVHRDWPVFCLKVALPLRRACEWLESDSRPLDEGEVLLTRRRLDVYFALGTALAAAVGMFSWWVGGNRAPLAAPGFMIAIWLFCRLNIPKRGARSHRLSVIGKWRALLLVSWLVGLPLAVAAIRLLVPRGVGHLVLIVLGVGTIVLILVFAYRENRQRERQVVEAASAAVEEWELGEPPCPPSPSAAS